MGLELTIFHEHDLPLGTQHRFDNFIYCIIYNIRGCNVIRRCKMPAGLIHARGKVKIFFNQQELSPPFAC